MSMNSRPFSVNVAAMVVALTMGLAMTTSITTKQAVVLDPKHCNTDEVLLLQRRIQ